MKGLVLLLSLACPMVLAHGLTNEENQRIKVVHEECQADPKTHVEEEVLIKLRKGQHVEKSVVGAHILCMSKGLRFQKENGEIDKEEVEKKFARAIHDATKLKEAVKECAIDKDDEIDTALDLLKCYNDHSNSFGHSGV